MQLSETFVDFMKSLGIILGTVALLWKFIKPRLEESLTKSLSVKIDEKMGIVKKELSLIGKDIWKIQNEAGEKQKLGQMTDEQVNQQLLEIKRENEQMKRDFHNLALDNTALKERLGLFSEFLRSRRGDS